MLKSTLLEIFERDLNKLIEEINLYKQEESLWEIKEGISNSAGNLCLHLVGNLNYFIGATLGQTGYIRHREDEFNLKNILRTDLIININNCALIVKETIEKLTVEDLNKDFPLEKHGSVVSTTHMLVHLLVHLGYHLGQINYHRRLIG